MNVAFCYDRINKFGGAERVLQAMHEVWPDAPVYTLTYSPDTALWARGWDIRSSFLQRIPFLGQKHELFPPLAPLAWERFNFNEYDVVISVTSAEAKGIITAPRTKHICYCLTPTRYYWSGYREYLAHSGFGILSGVARKALSLFSYPLRVWDYFQAQRPDVLVAISREVQSRIAKYYRRDALILYPPVDIVNELVGEDTTQIAPYFLIVSRLVPYKRVDIVVEAFTRLGWPLVVVGTGSEKDVLQHRSGKNISFVGHVTEEKLRYYYTHCLAFVFPTLEDFGIAPVEAQGYGKPVVAYRGGGALETVVEGKTGVFFEEQTALSLVALLQNISSSKGTTSGVIPPEVCAYFKEFSAVLCHQNALQYSKVGFQEKLKLLVGA
jgi:glycosyltransferase involved in cell wall biosynthesis